VFNPFAQKLTGQHTDAFPTISLAGDPKTLGLAWNQVMESESCYFENKLSTDFPKGKAEITVKGIYTGKNSHYLVLSLLEIKLLPKKR
jgi:hypothetical protein